MTPCGPIKVNGGFASIFRAEYATNETDVKTEADEDLLSSWFLESLIAP
jgi:hypothetical protein